MILPDYPIEDSGGDKLRRLPLAKKVAELIDSFDSKESYVIGIEGLWGSGKTSFINLILNELTQEKNIVIKFNPWNFTDQNELIKDFYISLSEAVKNNGNKNLWKSLSKYAKKLSFSFSPSLPIPYIGSLGMGELWAHGTKTLAEERREIDLALQKLLKKIVIVIDDIDRLDKSETCLIMRLVKLTANFSNTVFLLAYDRKRVAERLEDSGWSGEEYLKKIIQTSFTLPEPDRQEVKQILFTDLENTIALKYGNADLSDEEIKYWRELLYSDFDKLFRTIRDIKRFISSIRLNWSIIDKNDVNKIDFIGIEAIRVFAPSFYSQIASNKSFFTSTERSLLSSHSFHDSAAKEERYKQLILSVPEEVRGCIDRITKTLFPQLNFKSTYASDWQQQWRKDKRICAEERFDFYFQLGIPVGAVSETEITSLISSLENSKVFATNFIKFISDKRVRMVLTKLLDHIKELDENAIKNLILGLWNLEKDLDEVRVAILDFDDAPTQILRLGYNGLLEVISKEKRFEFIKELVERDAFLYFPTELLITLAQDSEKRQKMGEELIVNEKELTELKDLIVKKIMESATAGTLVEEKRFSVLLHIWERWGKSDDVKKYIATLIQTRSGVIGFLTGLIRTILSTGGNYEELVTEEIERYINIDILEKEIAKIESDHINKQTENENRVISLYKKRKKSNSLEEE